jgi:hypothetical protein
MFAGHPICGFVGISGRDNVRLLMLPAATAVKLDLVYVHGDAPFYCHSLRAIRDQSSSEGMIRDNRIEVRAKPSARSRTASGAASP